MENQRMGADAIIPDHVMIQIFPSQNRFGAFLWHSDEVEKLHTGQLDQLLPHLAGLNDVYVKGRDAANFKLQLEKGNADDVSWFTKSTVNRFLQLVESPDFWKSSKAIEAEMSQLEQARNLYAQPDGKTASSDSSKRELLRAMNLRVTALLNGLNAALKQAVGAPFTSEEINHLAKFCDHFGSADLRNSLCKLLKMIYSSDMSALQNNGNHSLTQIWRRENGPKVAGEGEKSGPLYTVTPVKYGVSPAMAAQLERQSSSESEESSCSSGENDTLAERGRGLTVSAPARRLASPMRRVQIARTKSRRTPSLTIKSLGCHPGRERPTVFRDSDAVSGEEEGSEQQSSEKLESKKRMMTVQDAIHLFESKQKDQNEDDRKRSSLCSSSAHTVKPVLRRWSAGVTLSSSPSKRDLTLEDSAIHCPSSLPSNFVTQSEIAVTDSPTEQSVAENEDITHNVVKTTDPEVEECAVNEDNAVDFQTNNKSTEDNGSERLAASTEWIRQKELQFNQMVKMMEDQDLKAKIPRTRKEVTPMVQKGGLYDRYKERTKKLQTEQAGKKTENCTRSGAMKQNLLERKSGTSSSKAKDHGKQVSLKNPHESLKKSSNSSSPRDESLNASIPKKVSSKTSNMLASRKSWPSMLPSTAAKTSESKFSPRNAESGTRPVHQKPLATTKLPSPKIERHNHHQRKLEETLNISNGKLKHVKDEKHTVKKSEKEQKGKLAVAAGDDSGRGPPKSSSQGRIKKKSSVMPVEGKPLIQKGSAAANGVNPVVNNTNQSHQPDKFAAKPKNAVRTHENVESADASGPPNENVQQVIGSDGHNCLPAETEKLIERDQNSGETKNCNELSNGVTHDCSNVAQPSLAEVQSEEEFVLSLTARVENEIDEQLDVRLLNDNNMMQPPSLIHVANAGLPNSRVHHSLSEMLQEDSSEPDDTPEWGNAENPPPLAYQRDALKGLKRLLKFSRNGKGDVNLTELSGSSTFPEVDDVDEIVAVHKRNNYFPPSKEALHSNIRKQETMNAAESSVQPKFGRVNIQKMHRDHVSIEVPKTKGRSFFSLSAFRNS